MLTATGLPMVIAGNTALVNGGAAVDRSPGGAEPQPSDHLAGDTAPVRTTHNNVPPTI